MKIILGGPAKSGKSCLRHGLKAAVRAATGDAVYCYFVTANPDGEGAWFHEAAARDPELARQLKTDYKGAYTELFVTLASQFVANSTEKLTLVDIGGRTSVENRRICAAATHAVLLAPTPDEFAEWERFCADLNLCVIARFISDYHGTADAWHRAPDGVLEGSIHHLERGEPLGDRPAIVQLARHILNQL